MEIHDKSLALDYFTIAIQQIERENIGIIGIQFNFQRIFSHLPFSLKAAGKQKNILIEIRL